MSRLHALLTVAARRKRLPAVRAYNRIDGPGSSLDLRELQQAFWSLPPQPDESAPDPSMSWTRSLPRTVGITIDTGTRIHAEPFDPAMIAVQSIEYGTEVTAAAGEVPLVRENWLLKILDVFGLSGVKFILHNLRPGIQSSGLGGSASAATGVCILANELSGRRFSPVQLVAMASLIEQDFGVSLTGTQEQSNVMFGGVCDYVWFPWGIPGRADTGYGASIRTELVPPAQYGDIEARFAIFHSGLRRHSTDVNTVWVKALARLEGYRLHRFQVETAYQFREGIRLHAWHDVRDAIKAYQETRTELCPAYMTGAAEIQGFARESDCVVFPLGAGGGGGILVFASDPDSLKMLRHELGPVYREIPFKIQSRGHEVNNLPMEDDHP